MMATGDYLTSPRRSPKLSYRVVLNCPANGTKPASLLLANLLRHSLPESHEPQRINAEIKRGRLVLVPRTSPNVREPNANTPSARRHTHTVYRRIAPIVGGGRWRMFATSTRRERARQIAEAAARANVPQIRIRKDLRQFFVGGCTAFGLASRRGGQLGALQKGGKKRGPKRRGGVEGVPIIGKLRQQIIRLILRLEGEGKSVSQIYDEIVDQFFSEVCFVRGQKQLKALGPDRRISREQLKHLRRELHQDGRLRKLKAGPRVYASKVEGGTGNWQQEVSGPGQVYMLDDSGTQVEIVSASNRKQQVSTARFAIVLDVYSKRVVGFYVGVDDAKWENAATAMFYAFSSKTGLFRRFKLKEPAKFEAKGACHLLVMDRAPENTGGSSNILAEIGICDVMTTRAWRGRDKPFVERAIKSFKDRFFKLLSGWRAKGGKPRGARNPKLDAVLTLQELTQLFLSAVIDHNSSPLGLESIPLNARGKDLTTPYQLWDFGVEHQTGELGELDSRNLKLSLLRESSAMVTSVGVKYRGAIYDCARFRARDLYSTVRATRTFRISVREDPLNPSRIYHWDARSRKLLHLRRKLQGEGRDGFYFHDFEAEAARHRDCVRRHDRDSYANGHHQHHRRVVETQQRAKDRQAETPGKWVAKGTQAIRSARHHEKDERDSHGLGAIPRSKGKVGARIVPRVRKSLLDDLRNRDRDRLRARLERVQS